MVTWVTFWSCFFWFSLTAFLLNPTNFISLLFYSEITWVCLYCFSVLTGALNDDLTLFSLSFFILGLAGLEFSLGFLLIVNFKNFNKSLFFYDNDKIFNQFLNKKNINTVLISYKNNY